MMDKGFFGFGGTLMGLQGTFSVFKGILGISRNFKEFKGNIHHKHDLGLK